MLVRHLSTNNTTASPTTKARCSQASRVYGAVGSLSAVPKIAPPKSAKSQVIGIPTSSQTTMITMNTKTKKVTRLNRAIKITSVVVSIV